jgi:cellular nucleic acid-binding protein
MTFILGRLLTPFSHRKTECPEPLKPRGGGGGGGRACFNCGQEGHNSRDCTEPRVMRCRNCDDEGHMSKECPKPRDYSRVKCNNCGQMGHTVKRCTEPVTETNNDGWDNGGGDSATAAAAGGWAAAEPDAGTAQMASTDWADDANDAAAAAADADNGGW